jgi:hypothetical protein
LGAERPASHDFVDLGLLVQWLPGIDRQEEFGDEFNMLHLLQLTWRKQPIRFEARPILVETAPCDNGDSLIAIRGALLLWRQRSPESRRGRRNLLGRPDQPTQRSSRARVAAT